MGWTNKGKRRILEWALRGGTIPTTFYVALFTSAVAPTVDTNTKSELTEIASGNGYTTGGIAVNNDSTDFDTLTEDDTLNKAFVQIKDLIWTASGGSIPASGSPALYACLTDDNATQDSREILVWWDLETGYSATVGNTIRLPNLEISIN